jgi:7,8-dihydropterin-6-yl-methyl-4-(beta-D-ribofuranosyl)aminobenzene 5'-phosphate synthase
MKILLLTVFFTATILNISFGGTTPKKPPLTIWIVYDNNPYDPNLQTEWGFSCLIRGKEKTILFDIGGNGKTLLSNMDKMKIKPEDVDLVVLSHIHGDHTGGLDEFLKKNSRVKVYLPRSFPSGFKKDIKKAGAQCVEVEKPLEICNEVFSNGEMGSLIKEQSLIIKTEKGLVVITGCAHPGIVEIVKKAKEFLNEDIYLVMGGFHLLSTSEKGIEKIINEFQKLGVKKAAPCHCSGELCQQIFEDKYKKDYLKLGVGAELEVK